MNEKSVMSVSTVRRIQSIQGSWQTREFWYGVTGCPSIWDLGASSDIAISSIWGGGGGGKRGLCL